jgi:hypothetical protein
MLNSKNERELAYVVKINSVEPIVGSDNCEAAIVGGWRVMVRKGQFEPGDLAVYFEIDSKLPENDERFAFMARKNYKVKTQRYTFGGKGLMISQGLLMSAEDLGWNKEDMTEFGDDRFVTKKLGVTYAVAEDNIRKGSGDPNQKYKAMGARHIKLAKTRWWRWLMKREWGRKLLFKFFGKKKDNPRGWPNHFPYIHKTDEERCENMPWILQNKEPWIVTEKLDGTSCTYILERLKGRNKYEFYVLSRNVRQKDETQACYHDHNIYWDLAFKYDIENKLKQYLDVNQEMTYVCIQGEGVGSVQGNPLKLKEDDLYVFNFIDSMQGRYPSTIGREIIEKMGMQWVPILDEHFILPDDMETFKQMATAPSAVNPAVMREGIVLRQIADGMSFKNVSREYLLKHNG